MGILHVPGSLRIHRLGDKFKNKFLFVAKVMKRLSDICGKSGQVKGTEKSKKGGEVDQQKCL